MLLNSYRFVAAGGGDPHWSDVSLLLHFDGTDGSTTFVDSSNASRTPSNVYGTAQIDSNTLLLDAASGIKYANYSGFDLGTGAFTVECTWKNASTGSAVLFDLRTSTSGPGGALYYNAGYIRYYIGSTDVIVYSFTPTPGTSYRVQLSRDGSQTLRLFIDGVLVSTVTSHSYNYNGSTVAVGQEFSQAFGLNGTLDEFRVTKGVARNTATHTPEATPFPDS